MKKVWEGLKDILYDSTDYFIMIAIIGIVVFVIGWRLDLLFANDTKDILPKDNIIVEKDDAKVVDNPTKEAPGKEEPKKDSTTDKTITITIPPGSTSYSIGAILESNGLVSSKAEFVKKSEELGLDTKLKAGKHEIKTNTPIADIVRLLTK